MLRFLLTIPAVLVSLVWWLFVPDKPRLAPLPAPPEPDPGAPSAESREEGHEVTDASPKMIAWFVVGLFMTIFVAMAALGWMYTHLYAPGNAMPVRPRQESFKHAPATRTSIAKDWSVINALAHQRLDGYGWIDRTQGVVRIPIDHAAELVAKDGLPARAGQTPYFPPPDQEKLPLMQLETNDDATKFDPH